MSHSCYSPGSQNLDFKKKCGSWLRQGDATTNAGRSMEGLCCALKLPILDKTQRLGDWKNAPSDFLHWKGCNRSHQRVTSRSEDTERTQRSEAMVINPVPSVDCKGCGCHSQRDGKHTSIFRLEGKTPTVLRMFISGKQMSYVQLCVVSITRILVFQDVDRL